MTAAKLSGPDFPLNETAKARGPSFCWHCGRKLRHLHSANVIDPITHYGYTVHKSCAADAEASLRRQQFWIKKDIRDSHAAIHPEDTF